jgi:hypothetical protein
MNRHVRESWILALIVSILALVLALATVLLVGGCASAREVAKGEHLVNPTPLGISPPPISVCLPPGVPALSNLTRIASRSGLVKQGSGGVRPVRQEAYTDAQGGEYVFTWLLGQPPRILLAVDLDPRGPTPPWIDLGAVSPTAFELVAEPRQACSWAPLRVSERPSGELMT